MCLGYPVVIAAISPESDVARSMADAIFSRIAKTVEERVEKLTREDYTRLYGLNKEGKPIYPVVDQANDLVHLTGGYGDKTLWPEEYFGEINDFVNSNENVEFNYDIVGVSIIKQPKLEKDEKSEYAEVLVKTEWIFGGKIYGIIDKVHVNVEQRNVPYIYNEFMSLRDVPTETIEGMLAKATAFYNNKEYDEAAALYNQITQKYPDNDDAWYFLGVMYFKMQGVGKLSQKQRLQKAYDCWKHSNLKKARRAISYITDGRE